MLKDSVNDLLKPNNKCLTEFKIINDNKGNIFIYLYLIMIISLVLIAILVLNLLVGYDEINHNELNLKTFNYILNDHEENIPVLSYNILENLSNRVLKSGVPLIDSKESIKEELKKNLLKKNKEYYKNSGIQIESNILYVENGKDPFHINIGTIITAFKGDINYKKQITSEISVENLKNPLPAVKCSKYPNFSYNDTNYNYGDSLSKYLEVKNQAGSQMEPHN